MIDLLMNDMINIIADNHSKIDLSNNNFFQNILKITDDNISNSSDNDFKNDLEYDLRYDIRYDVKNDSIHDVKNGSIHDVKNGSIHDVKNDSRHDEPKNNLQCIICLENIKVKYVLVSCGHTNVCASCIPKCDSKCPTCRRKIEKYIKLYDAQF